MSRSRKKLITALAPAVLVIAVVVIALPSASGATPTGSAAVATTQTTFSITSSTVSSITTTICPPVTLGVTQQPTSQTVIAGDTATFTAVATEGSCPISEQWFVS